MRLRNIWDQLYLSIRNHYLIIFGFLIGLSGGLFTGILGLLLGILLEPLVQQFLLERSITSYLVQADPRFTAEVQPGITAFCGLAVYCIGPDQIQEAEFTQKAIVQKALDLFHCSSSDGPRLETICRLAWDNRDLLNTDLLAESLKARLNNEIDPEKIILALQELVTNFAPNQVHRVNSIAHGITPDTMKSKKDGPWNILGLSPEASVQEIKKTFRRLALQFHPDRLSSLSVEQKQAAEECFITIRYAYRQALSEKMEQKSRRS
jgi:hypothetical protein